MTNQVRPVVWQDVEEFDVRLTRLLRMVLDLADRIDRLERTDDRVGVLTAALEEISAAETDSDPSGRIARAALGRRPA